MKSSIFAAALLSGLAFATAAQATPIMYQFGATQQFGAASATGFFTFDAATNQESAISITISGIGAGFDGVYTQAGPVTPPPTTPVFGTSAADIIVGNSGVNQAWLGFAAPLSPSGGTISLFGVFSGGAATQFQIPTGSATAIVGAPEPGTFAVLGVGILGLVGLGLQRRAATPPVTPL